MERWTVFEKRWLKPDKKEVSVERTKNEFLQEKNENALIYAD